MGLVRPGVQAATTSVIADAGAVVVADIAGINAMDAAIHSSDGAVVVEGTVIPIASFVAGAKVAVAVVDTAIKSDVGAPIATVPKISIANKSPIAGRPKGSNIGREYPGSRHPVVAGR